MVLVVFNVTFLLVFVPMEANLVPTDEFWSLRTGSCSLQTSSGPHPVESRLFWTVWRVNYFIRVRVDVAESMLRAMLCWWGLTSPKQTLSVHSCTVVPCLSKYLGSLSHLSLISHSSLTHLPHISHPSPSHLSPISLTSLTHLPHISHSSPSHLSHTLSHLSPMSLTSLTHLPHISHPSPSHLSSISLSHSSPCRFWTLSASFTV